MHPPLLNVADYARAARAKLPKEVYDYYEGGALDEITLRENTAGWEGLKLYYRVLAGVGAREMKTTMLGQSISMPIAVAPTAFHKLACAEGEIATARAAKAARTLFILSSLSNTAMEPALAEAASPLTSETISNPISASKILIGSVVALASRLSSKAFVAATMGAVLRSTARKRSSFQITADGSSTLRPPLVKCCRTSSKQSTIVVKFMSMVEFVAAAML